MSLPDSLLQVSWREHFRAEPTSQERRYRSEWRAARQVAAIVAAPDHVVELVGVWRTNGGTDRLHWTRLDPAEFLAGVEADHPARGMDDDVGLADFERLIATAWAEHDARQEAHT